MKVDVREINIGDTVYTTNDGKVRTVEVKEFWDKVALVAQPLCMLDWFDSEEEAKDLAKKQLQAKMDNL